MSGVLESGIEFLSEHLIAKVQSLHYHIKARTIFRGTNWRIVVNGREHGEPLAKAAEVFGMSRRMIAYYNIRAKPIPTHVGLACKGYEAILKEQKTQRAA